MAKLLLRILIGPCNLNLTLHKMEAKNKEIHPINLLRLNLKIFSLGQKMTDYKLIKLKKFSQKL